MISTLGFDMKTYDKSVDVYSVPSLNGWLVVLQVLEEECKVVFTLLREGGGERGYTGIHSPFFSFYCKFFDVKNNL